MRSIKFLLTTVVLAAATTAASAQTTTASAPDKAGMPNHKSVYFGIKGGANFSTVNGSNYTPDYRFNFHAGLLAEIPVSAKFSVQVEGLYSAQGYEIKFQGPDNEKAEVNFDYINVPVLARVYVLKCLSIDAGPQISFLVNDEVKLSPNPAVGNIKLNPADPNNFEFGIAAGLTIQTEIGLFISGRYTYALTKIYDTANKDDITFDGLHNQVFQASLGYKF